MKHYFSNAFITDKSVTGYDIALKTYIDTYGYLFPEHYQDLKTCTMNIQVSDITKTKEAMARLINGGYINAKEVDKNIYFISAPNKEQIPFIGIDVETINKIISSDYTFKFSMLKHFCMIMVHRFYNKIYDAAYVCDRSLDFFASEEGVGARVLSKYNTILENMGLLYIFRSINTQKTNLYSLPKDARYAISYAEYTNRIASTPDADKKRSLMQKYNRLFIEGAKCGYSDEEISEIKEYIKNYNSVVKSVNQKDMSIFDTI